MNSGLVEARDMATHLSRVLRADAPPSVLEEFAIESHHTWQRLLGAEHTVRALPGADPWVRQAASRMLACIPASGDDLESLLAQIGLTVAPS
jgi:hypothetical protein